MSETSGAGARPLSEAAQRVQDALRGRGFTNQVIELDVPVRTAEAAAAAVGCEVAEIVKSLVFRGRTSGHPVIVEVSGTHRVDVSKVEAVLGEPIEMGDPKFVREITGFAIGGIPPIGHTHVIKTLIDPDLMIHDELWAAAGHPNSLFRLAPDELVRMTGGHLVNVT